MKFSKYNIFTEIEDYHLLTNTYTGSIFKVDEETKDIIVNERLKSLSDDYIKIYFDKGIIISDDRDEFKELEYSKIKTKFVYDSLNLTLLLTNNCNFKCIYCFQGHERNNLFLEECTSNNILEFIKSYMNYNKNIKKIHITLFGGEPLLNITKQESFLDNINIFCKENDLLFTTGIITNGSLINNTTINILKKHNCKYIQITLDGIEKIHNSRRMYNDGRGSFFDVMDGIKNVYNESELPNPSIRINIDKKNISTIPNLIEILNNENLNECFISLALVRSSENNNVYEDNSLSEKELKGLFIPIWTQLLKLNFNFNTKPNRITLFCGAYAENFFTIDTDGKIYKCWDLVGNDTYCVGDINDKEQLIKQTKYIDWIMRDNNDVNKCKSCSYLPVCGGGCANISYERYKDINKEACFENKWLYHDQVLFNHKYL